MTMTDRLRWEGAFGCSIKRGFFTKEEIASMRDMVFYLTEQPDQKDYIWKYYEYCSDKVNRIEYFVNYHEGLKDLANSGKILKEVETFLGEPPVLFKDKVNYKYPNSEHFLPHQDITAGWGVYSHKHVSIAIPLCDTSKENGGLYFAEAVKDQLSDIYTDLDIDMPYNLKATNEGDVIFFDSYVPHASYENKTSDPRPILVFTYTPKSKGDYYEEYHSDKFKNVPPDIYKEAGKAYRSGNTNLTKVYQKVDNK